MMTMRARAPSCDLLCRRGGGSQQTKDQFDHSNWRRAGFKKTGEARPRIRWRVTLNLESGSYQRCNVAGIIEQMQTLNPKLKTPRATRTSSPRYFVTQTNNVWICNGMGV